MNIQMLPQVFQVLAKVYEDNLSLLVRCPFYCLEVDVREEVLAFVDIEPPESLYCIIVLPDHLPCRL